MSEVNSKISEVLSATHLSDQSPTREDHEEDDDRKKEDANDGEPRKPYFVVCRTAVLAADSTQFVTPPVLSTNLVIGNCGSQSTSRPLRLPVTLAATKPAKAPSSRWTPFPPLPVAEPNSLSSISAGAGAGWH